jgi:hypothetical protein
MEGAMRRLLQLACVGAGILTLSGCATTNVRSFVERGIDVGRYRTYAWAPADEQATGDPRLDNNRFFEERVRAAVENNLNASGFEKADAGPAELLIHFHARVEQQVNPNGADQPYAFCEDCDPYVFDAATLVIDLVDAQTRQLVWRGWSEGSIDGVVDSQTWMEKRVDDTIAKILEQLPRAMRRTS